MSVDPLAEKYAGISSFAYVANNPIKFVDPDGRRIDEYSVDRKGNIKLENSTNDNSDILYTKESWDSGKKDKSIVVRDENILPQLAKKENPITEKVLATKETSYIANTKNRADAYNLFEFIAKNNDNETSYQRYTDNTLSLSISDPSSNSSVIPGNFHPSNKDKIVAADIHSHGGTIPSIDFKPSPEDYHRAKVFHLENKDVKVQLFMPQNPNPNARWLDLVNNKWIK